MRNISRPRRMSFGPLNAVEFPASEGSPSIICLHGYGANSSDLAPLAAQFDLTVPMRWLFPDGPIPMGIGPFAQGRAWFPIDETEMARVQMSGENLNLTKMRPQGFDAALTALTEFIHASQTPWSKLVIGGFSQGAMLAVEAALKAPETPLGLFILSGTPVDEETILKFAPARSGLKFFQSHGTYDTVLGYGEAKHLNDLLNSAGLQGELITFQGGHELPNSVAQGLQRYINGILEASHEPTKNA